MSSRVRMRVLVVRLLCYRRVLVLMILRRLLRSVLILRIKGDGPARCSFASGGLKQFAFPGLPFPGLPGVN